MPGFHFGSADVGGVAPLLCHQHPMPWVGFTCVLLITLLDQNPPFAPLLSTRTQQLFAEGVGMDVLALTGRWKASAGFQISDE